MSLLAETDYSTRSFKNHWYPYETFTTDWWLGSSLQLLLWHGQRRGWQGTSKYTTQTWIRSAQKTKRVITSHTKKCFSFCKLCKTCFPISVPGKYFRHAQCIHVSLHITFDAIIRFLSSFFDSIYICPTLSSTSAASFTSISREVGTAFHHKSIPLTSAKTMILIIGGLMHRCVTKHCCIQTPNDFALYS